MTVIVSRSTVIGWSWATASSRSIASCGSTTGTMPFFTALPEKMSEKDGAITARTPRSASAQAACSRLDPQPKLSPAIRTGAPA